MDYKEHIERVLNYIEDNLKKEITVEELSHAAGYSKYHFLRVFYEVVKLTPADYIRKRRISEIAREIMESERPVSDIAFGYGFNSKENFTRAFKAEHHILPTEYKSAGNSLKLYDRIKFETAPFSVTPKFVELDEFSVTAYSCFERYIPNFWNQYNSRKLSRKLSGGKSVADFGIGGFNQKILEWGYFIGIRTDEAAGDISGTINLTIPGGLYAVFTTPKSTHFDYVNTVHKTWDYIRSWLPESKYNHTGGYQFETYVEDSRTFSEDIYIPIKEK